jgi:predicted GNAT family acetyltransferase
MNTIEHDEGAHRFTTEIDGVTAELDYTLTAKTMTITHTGVPAAIAGRGVAGTLMHAAMAAARSEGWQVIPACSYAAAYLRRHPDEAERKHAEDLLDEALDESFPASDSPSVGASD